MSSQPQPVPLLGWDLAAWRLAEADPSLRSTVVGIVAIDGPLDSDHVLSRVREAVATQRVLRSVVVSTPAGPALQELASFTGDECVSFETATSQVEVVAHRLAEAHFDAQRPLWRLAVISREQRSYIVAALHHAITDGNGALGLAGYLFDEYQVQVDAGGASTAADEVTRGLQSALKRVLERGLRDPQGLARDVNSVLKSLTKVLNVPQTAHAQAMAERSASFGESYFLFPKSAVRAAIVGKGVTQHDALVAAVCRALYLYHQKSGVKLERLRINVPVALSVEAAAANQLVVARLELDLSDPHPAALMRQSNDRLHAWRSEPALAVVSELVEASRLIPAAMIASVVKKADATISSLRGVARLGHIDGYAVSGIWPLVAPVGAAVSVTSVGVGADVSMCVTHDSAAVTNSNLWRQCLVDAMSETAGVTLVLHDFR